MQVWVTARGQVAAVASGSPVSPSQTVMHTSATPRVLSSVSTREPVLGALAAVTGPQPQDVALAVDGDAQDHVHGPVGTCPSRILTWMASMNSTG